MLRFDGPFGPQWSFVSSRVGSRNKTKVGLPLAKSFSADLGGNESNHSSFEAKEESIANEVKLKA